MEWTLWAIVMLAMMLVGLAVLLVAVCKMSLEAIEDARQEEKANHAACIAHVAHYTGDSFAAQVLRLAAQDLQSVEGQATLREIANTEWKPGSPPIPSLWLLDRADQLIQNHEESE